MKLLLDMNLSPTWVRFLEENGFEAVHWSTTGEPTATDAVVMAWSRDRGFVAITHDLDFSAILATTEAVGPSVVQVRTQDVLPDAAVRTSCGCFEPTRPRWTKAPSSASTS